MDKEMMKRILPVLIAYVLVPGIFIVLAGVEAAYQEVDPMNSFLEGVFIPQPWRYPVQDGETKRSLIVTYVGPEDDVEYDMHHIRSTMREFPSIYCEGDFQPGLIRELNGRTGDLEIVCVYQWEEFHNNRNRGH